MNQEPLSRELLAREIALKSLEEKVRDLEKALREARAVADEALRIARRAKRELVTYR